jgi:hypothetical protein
MKRIAAVAFAFVGLALTTTSVLAIDGCGAGTVNTFVAPDGMSVTKTFSGFSGSDGDVVTCSVNFPVRSSIPSGHVVVYSADYRGFYDIEAGDQMTFSTTNNGNTDTETVNGPDDSVVSVTVQSNLAASSNGTVTVGGVLDLSNASNGSFAEIESADYAELGTITLATDQTAMITHLSATAELLTGGTQPAEGGNEVGLIGGYGSAMMGAVGRYNIAEGFSVLSGLSLVDQSAGATRSIGIVGAAAIRYIEPDYNTFRLFAEGGLVLGGFQTTHSNTASPVATGLGSLYAKGGALFDLTPEAHLSLSGTIMESALSTAAFTQSFPGFTANIAAQTGLFTTAKATTALTYDVTPEVDLTAEASIGTVISHSGITATIPGLGTVSASQNNSFVAYGARAGWKPTDTLRLEAFAQGTSGPDVGTHNMIGVGAKFQF